MLMFLRSISQRPTLRPWPPHVPVVILYHNYRILLFVEFPCAPAGLYGVDLLSTLYTIKLLSSAFENEIRYIVTLIQLMQGIE